MVENAGPGAVTRTVITGAQLTILIVLTGVLVILQAWQILRGTSVQRQRWEYAIESPADDALPARLRALGLAGWEIVSARRATSEVNGRNVAAYEMILRRPAEITDALPVPIAPPR